MLMVIPDGRLVVTGQVPSLPATVQVPADLRRPYPAGEIDQVVLNSW